MINILAVWSKEGIRGKQLCSTPLPMIFLSTPINFYFEPLENFYTPQCMYAVWGNKITYAPDKLCTTFFSVKLSFQ